LLEAEKNYERAIPLAELAAISQSALDQYRASFASAQAQVRMAEAALRNSQINLQYAKIYAFIQIVAFFAKILAISLLLVINRDPPQSLDNFGRVYLLRSFRRATLQK
jgi:multidrug efflux pump subunit AcrA (membrane-fusion protein)